METVFAFVDFACDYRRFLRHSNNTANPMVLIIVGSGTLVTVN
jgi:hypothetical protein